MPHDEINAAKYTFEKLYNIEIWNFQKMERIFEEHDNSFVMWDKNFQCSTNQPASISVAIHIIKIYTSENTLSWK